MRVAFAVIAALAAVVELASAQLTKTVGPTTALSAKQTKICNVLDYGGTVGSDDIGPAILSAFTNCVTKNSGSTLYVPAGNYNMKTWVTLNKGTKWAFRLDGFITRTATTGGHMIIIMNANDFEMYSSTSAGGFQGHGFECRNTGPRFLRMVTSTSWSVHDLVFTDSPAFNIIVQAGAQGEIYNIAIRGANMGGSDGIDVTGDNHWIHDVMVTNKDECVTVKSPASNILIENIWCNWSGGSAIGSLSTGTAISNVVYRNVYTVSGNQAMMVKSNGGSGYVKNVLMENFLVRGSAYGLDINQYWSSQSVGDGAGVQLSDFVFKNWNGAVANGIQRPPVQFLCADGAPCTNMTLTGVNLWSQTGKGIYKWQSAYGSGLQGLKAQSGTHTSYATVTATPTQPAGYTAVPTMAGDLTTGFGSLSAIPTPTIPTMYYPGVPQISPLAKNKSKRTVPRSHPSRVKYEDSGAF